MQILEKIKTLKEERGWSNYRLARESGISEGTINNLFRLNNQPTLPTLEAICKGLGISLTQFFSDGSEAVILNEEQKEMLNAFSKLNKPQKDTLLIFLKTI